MGKGRKMKDKNYLKKSAPLTEKEMDSFKLSNEEKQEARNINAGVYEPVSKEKLSKYKKSQEDFKKSRTKPVLIRFDINDLNVIKKKAKLEGLPYQTYIKSVMHKMCHQ
jgi:predicted DNA binding CopG/RHH family protein